jgi:hypothetical protein
MPQMFTCKKCKETKPLEGFYTNSKVDKNKPYQLVCRKCYQEIRRAREGHVPRVEKETGRVNTPIADRSINNPASLTCTIRQFHEFFGPKVRNEIQTLTKREKKRLNSVCQRCHEKAELDAAHMKGNDRKRIIDSILSKYLVAKKEQVIQVDLRKVMDEILEAHQPINEHFMFLCSSCHRKYDNEN